MGALEHRRSPTSTWMQPRVPMRPCRERTRSSTGSESSHTQGHGPELLWQACQRLSGYRLGRCRVRPNQTSVLPRPGWNMGVNELHSVVARIPNCLQRAVGKLPQTRQREPVHVQAERTLIISVHFSLGWLHCDPWRCPSKRLRPPASFQTASVPLSKSRCPALSAGACTADGAIP